MYVCTEEEAAVGLQTILTDVESKLMKLKLYLLL